jgi:hypothetical protein
MALGMDVWNCVVACLEDYIHKDTYIQKEFDLRIFRMIWEHKKLMHNRISVLNDELNLKGDILSEMKDIVEQAYVAFQLAIKYTLEKKHSSEHLKKIIKIYNELESKEKVLYPQIVKVMQKENDND